jgi:hypothetical protein
MALLILRLLIFAVPVVLITKQVILPLWRGDRLFPALNKKPQLVKHAEQELLEAQAAKKAAEINQEAALLNKEAWTISENTYEIKD